MNDTLPLAAPRSEVLLNASPEALAVTLVYLVTMLEASRERVSPEVMLAMIEDKLREYDGVERACGLKNGAMHHE